MTCKKRKYHRQASFIEEFQGKNLLSFRSEFRWMSSNLKSTDSQMVSTGGLCIPDICHFFISQKHKNTKTNSNSNLGGRCIYLFIIYFTDKKLHNLIHNVDSTYTLSEFYNCRRNDHNCAQIQLV